jgi:serine/alanine adding enzyme
VTEVTERDWREFLTITPRATVFQGPDMAAVVSHTRRHQSKTFAAKSEGAIRAILSVALVSYLNGRLPPVATRAIATGGPIGDPACFPTLLSRYERLIARQAVSTQIRNLEPSTWNGIFEELGYKWEDHINFISDLRDGERAVFSRIAKGRRHNIALADRLDLRCEVLSEKDLWDCYDLLKSTYARARIPLADVSLFRNAFRILAPRGLLWVLGVRHSDKLCALILLLRSNGTAYNWYNAVSEDGEKLHANEWLVWQGMKRAIETGDERFDFGGAGKPDDNYGPGIFKKHFGGQMYNQGRYEKIHHPVFFRASQLAYGVWRGLR